MTDWLFSPAPTASLPIVGRSDRFPVRRILCVGQNYAAHAREMGKDPDREPPFFFTKPADAVVPAEGTVPYPPLTENLHHEIELVIAIGAPNSRIALSTMASNTGCVSVIEPLMTRRISAVGASSPSAMTVAN